VGKDAPLALGTIELPGTSAVCRKELADRVISSKPTFSGRPSLTDESVASSLAATSVSSSSPDSILVQGVDSSPLSAQGRSPEEGVSGISAEETATKGS
jgi:hypothetical protein